jgi:hypothetical protein
MEKVLVILFTFLVSMATHLFLGFRIDIKGFRFILNGFLFKSRKTASEGKKELTRSKKHWTEILAQAFQ